LADANFAHYYGLHSECLENHACSLALMLIQLTLPNNRK
jgi:hypothetical protein